MHIGIDARLYRSSVAGIGRYSQNLIKNILEIDSDNQYVLFMTPEDNKEFMNSQNSGVKKNFKIIITDIPHYSLAEQTKLAKVIAAENLDLMHFLNFNFPVNYRGRFIVTIHDLTLFYYPGRTKNNFTYKLAYKYIFGQACKKSQKIIAVSESTKKDIVEKFNIPDSKIEVVYEAADDRNFKEPSEKTVEEVKKRYGVNDFPVVLYVGQWRHHKNIVNLVRAFDVLRKDIPARMVLVGKVDQAYSEAKETIDKAVALRDIIMPGFVSNEELAAWYKIASVFVFPSFYEGFGLPGIEAMMAGTPVVASDRTSLPEIYQDAAVYFNPDDPKDMADKVMRVISDKSLQEKLVCNGHRIAAALSWKKTAQETLKIYKTVIK